MTVQRQQRAAWTKRISRASAQGGPRRGVAVHWPGFNFVCTDHVDCLRLLDRLEREAIAGDYAALPYCQAACVHGFLIEGRGANRRSGANGSTLGNRDYGSVVALIPVDQQRLPGPLLEAIRASLSVQAPKGRLVTHAQVRPEPTACPGKLLTAWIQQGAPRPVATITVQDGDTLWSLAQKYLGNGIRWSEIAKANQLTDDELTPGQRLNLP